MSKGALELFTGDLLGIGSLSRGLGGALTLLLLVAGIPLAHGVARRLLGGMGGAAGRLAGAWLIIYGVLVLAFYGLIVPGLFRAVPGLVLMLVIIGGGVAALSGARTPAGWVAGWRELSRHFLKDVTAPFRDDGRGGLRSLTLGGAVAVACCLLILIVRLSRGVLAPPMVWDELGYQLVKTARWVADGAWVLYPAPDCWSYYEFFPAFGSMLWAWLSLGTGDLSLLWVAHGACWVLMVLGVAAWARAMGAERPAALAAGLLLALGPIVLGAVAVAHVDILGSACMGAGMAMVTLALRRIWVDPGAGRTMDARVIAGPAFLGALGLALAMGTKQSFVPMAALAGLVYGGALVWRLLAGVRLIHVGALALAAVVPIGLGSIPYLRAWILTGNPLHPFPSPLGEGNDQLIGAMRGRWLSMPEDIKGWEWEVIRTLVSAYFFDLRRLLVPDPLLPGDFLNFGPGGLVILFGAVAGLVVAARRPAMWKKARGGLVLAGLVVASVAAYFNSELALMQRTVWQEYSGRFALPAWVAFAAVMALCGWGTLQSVVFSVALMMGWFYAFPFGLDPGVEAAYVGLGGALAVGVMWFFVLGLQGGADGQRSQINNLAARWLCCVLAWLVLVPVISSLRIAARPDYHAGMVTGRIYNFHSLSPLHRSEAEIWNITDRMPPSTIAMSADFFHQGLNWYRLPLMGPRFQHRVIYVSPWVGGEIVNGDQIWNHGRAGGRMNGDVWVDRLRQARVDYVMLAGPLQPQLHLAEADPRHFSLIYETTTGTSRLYRFVPAPQDRATTAPVLQKGTQQ